MLAWETIYRKLQARIEQTGITVLSASLGDETTGQFDGLTITTNCDCDWETRCHNLAHSFGHVIQWSLDTPRFAGMYKQLEQNKKANDSVGLETTLQLFRQYEVEASQYAVWLLTDVGHSEAIESFTNFARADIESIIAFHRDGIAPIWHEFFAAWNRKMQASVQQPEPFPPLRVPDFSPKAIVSKRVIREVDGIA